ncbi:MAG: TonB family protein [Hyphomonadaceae bacterium]
MLVWATRRLPQAVARALILAGLFVLVVVLQTGFTSGLRAAGLPAGLALGLSGLLVLSVVLLINWRLQAAARARAEALEEARSAQGLPDGPCCVVWRGQSGEVTGAFDMPWTARDDFRIIYPQAAKALGIEGVAIVEFEISADGRAKNLACTDVWPSDVFYRAAAAALGEARFELKWGADARFGATYRIPFVFRIAGAAGIKDAGAKARPKRPILEAAAGAVERMRQRA